MKHLNPRTRKMQFLYSQLYFQRQKNGRAVKSAQVNYLFFPVAMREATRLSSGHALGHLHLAGTGRWPNVRTPPASSKNTSHDFSNDRISPISGSARTMQAVDSASDSAAVSQSAQVRSCRRAGRPVCGSRMCFPFTARPDPLSEAFFSQ